MRLISFSILLIFGSLQASAQLTNSAFETRYKRGVNFVKNSEWQNAQTEFSDLILSRSENPLAPYVYYFNGLSLLKLNKLFDAKLTLKNLSLRFPIWRKKEEAFYLQANIAFEEKDYNQALTYLTELESLPIKDDADEMKRYYLGQVSDKNLLSQLSSKFPNDQVIQEVLSGKPATPNVPTTSGIPAKKPKEIYNFAVLLPLDVKELDPEKQSRSNRYAVDMYQGMKLAKEQLKKEDISINLLAYDISNDADEMLELINNSTFQQVDLMIGPLFAETNKIARAYSDENGIPLVNPMSNNVGLISDSPLSFLAEPSSAIQGKKAAEFATKQAWLSRSVGIFYTNTSNDSTMAHNYRDALKAKGYEIVSFQKVQNSVDNIYAKLPEKKIGHIFLATTEKKTGLSMLSAMDKKEMNIPLFTTSESFSSTNLSAGIFSGKEIYCLDPEYLDKNKPEVDNFEKLYSSKYGLYPSYFSMQGYDIVLFWGRMLSKNIINLRKGLNQRAFQENMTLGGYDYRNSQDNQILTITTFQNYKFIPTR